MSKGSSTGLLSSSWNTSQRRISFLLCHQFSTTKSPFAPHQVPYRPVGRLVKDMLTCQVMAITVYGDICLRLYQLNILTQRRPVAPWLCVSKSQKVKNNFDTTTRRWLCVSVLAPFTVSPLVQPPAPLLEKERPQGTHSLTHSTTSSFTVQEHSTIHSVSLPLSLPLSAPLAGTYSLTHSLTRTLRQKTSSKMTEKRSSCE